MTGQELRQFIEVGLDCGKQTDILFFTNLNLVKDYIEGLRNWKILEKKIKINNILKDENGYYFVPPTNLSLVLGVYSKNIPLEYEYDFLENKIYLKTNQQEEINLKYKILSPKIENNTSWIFPERFHPILGYLYSAIYKAGVDFDSINFNNSARLDNDFKNFFTMMVNWDNDLKYQELNGSYEKSGFYDKHGLPTL